MLAVRVVTSVVDKSDLYFIADTVAHLGLPPRLDEAAPSFLLLGLASSSMYWAKIETQKEIGTYWTFPSLV